MPRMCVGIKHPLTLKLKLSLTPSLSLSPSHREECLYVCQCVKTPKDGMEWRKMRVCMSEREKERERERERWGENARKVFWRLWKFRQFEKWFSAEDFFFWFDRPQKNSTDQPKVLSAKKKFGDIVIAEKISNQNELSENRNSEKLIWWNILWLVTSLS